MNSVTVRISRPSMCIPQRAHDGDVVTFSVEEGEARMLVRDGYDWHVCESHSFIHSGEETDYRVETLVHEPTVATLTIAEAV